MKLLPVITIQLCIFLSGCFATGSAIVTGNVRPATDPATVKLYLEPPKEYETIGLVEASNELGWNDQELTDGAIAELKNQAAKLGANGVLLTGASKTTTTSVHGNDGYVYSITDDTKHVKGKAIYVLQE
ncbi:MAG: hypothetical protein RLT87_06225 [Gammaproteobacteria bacterium]